MTVTEVTDINQFRQIISNGRTSAFDFWAAWCGPCKMISPTFEKLSDEVTSIDYYKVDVDRAQDIAAELNIRAMPTFLIFKNGEKAAELVGARVTELTALITTNAA